MNTWRRGTFVEDLPDDALLLSKVDRDEGVSSIPSGAASQKGLTTVTLNDLVAVSEETASWPSLSDVLIHGAGTLFTIVLIWAAIRRLRKARAK